MAIPIKFKILIISEKKLNDMMMGMITLILMMVTLRERLFTLIFFWYTRKFSKKNKPVMVPRDISKMPAPDISPLFKARLKKEARK